MISAIQQLFLVMITMGAGISNPAADSQAVSDKEHKVIMQVTQADSVGQMVVIAQVKNTLRALPNARIEVICHSQGLSLLVTDESKVTKQVEELNRQGVVFAACENTMKKKKLRKEDLLPGVVTVPSAIAEIVLKQEAGWTYVKVGL